jgi:DNA repair protein RadC
LEELPLIKKWKHPGGKLREEGAASLTDGELLSTLSKTGIEKLIK